MRNEEKETVNKTFILSDESVNSYGFRLDMKKIKLDRFRANPVMLYNHDSLMGRWENLTLKEGKLFGTPVFMESKTEKFARQIKKRVEENFVKGASLGVEILGFEEGKDGISVVEAEVFECSVCDIPSNQNAIALYNKDGVKLEGNDLNLALKSISAKNLKVKNSEKMELSKLTYKTLGVDENASQKFIEEAVIALKNRNVELEKELTAISEQKISQLIEQGLSDGKFTHDQKEWFQELAKANFQLAEFTLKQLTPKQTLAGKERSNESKTEDKSKWTFSDWRKKDPTGLLKMKAEYPEMYAELLNF